MDRNSLLVYHLKRRSFDGSMRWRHHNVIYEVFRIKEAEKEYDPPKNIKKTAETSTKAKGEAQLTITVIA